MYLDDLNPWANREHVHDLDRLITQSAYVVSFLGICAQCTEQAGLCCGHEQRKLPNPVAPFKVNPVQTSRGVLNLSPM